MVESLVHEIVHKWFGLIVTPKWWNELWLNEGFARYFQYVLIDLILPHWQMVFINRYFEIEIKNKIKINLERAIYDQFF